ncbi:hypothetical protein D1BOALGB6SA_423 [Olavius sp. associated proteobacterium Delta 1]|nr:hypothetical protein D1BOALGB6SA_423 [Olavius sp. associated proteobacterium Delta 1]
MNVKPKNQKEVNPENISSGRNWDRLRRCRCESVRFCGVQDRKLARCSL